MDHQLIQQQNFILVSSTEQLQQNQIKIEQCFDEQQSEQPPVIIIPTQQRPLSEQTQQQVFAKKSTVKKLKSSEAKKQGQRKRSINRGRWTKEEDERLKK